MSWLSCRLAVVLPILLGLLGCGGGGGDGGTSSASTGSVSGRVVDAVDGSTGIPGVKVALSSRADGLSTTTDSQGRYTFGAAPSGSVRLSFTLPDGTFQAVNVDVSVSTSVTLELNVSLVRREQALPTSLRIELPGATVALGSSLQCQAVSTPATTLRPFWWIQGGVGTITQQGKFTPTKVGTGTIYCQLGNDAKASAQVTVVSPPQPGTTHTGTVKLDHDWYAGPSNAPIVTVEDPDLNQQPAVAEKVSVIAKSAVTDPSGESVQLAETGPDTGVFTGTFGWERPFSSTAATPIQQGNGKVGAYAEGGIATERLTVTYHDAADADGHSRDVSATATYEEPKSTVTGVVTNKTTGQPIGGAAVQLTGTSFKAVTRSDGSYAMYDVAAGTYALVIARDGYVLQTKTVTVE